MLWFKFVWWKRCKKKDGGTSLSLPLISIHIMLFLILAPPFAEAQCDCEKNPLFINEGDPGVDSKFYPVTTDIDSASCIMAVSCTGYQPIIFTVSMEDPSYESTPIEYTSSESAGEGQSTIHYNNFKCVLDTQTSSSVWSANGHMNLAGSTNPIKYNSVNCAGFSPPTTTSGF